MSKNLINIGTGAVGDHWHNIIIPSASHQDIEVGLSDEVVVTPKSLSGTIETLKELDKALRELILRVQALEKAE